MVFTKFILRNNKLDYENASDAKMCILGLYLSDDLRCSIEPYIRKSVADNSYGGGNITGIEVEDDTVTLYDPFTEENEEETKLVISKKEFLNILDEWEKVCKEKPKEVIITEENGKYKFEKKK